jgi:hypothetical protein
MSNASIRRLPGPSNQPIDGVLAAQVYDRLPLSRHAGAQDARLKSNAVCAFAIRSDFITLRQNANDDGSR